MTIINDPKVSVALTPDFSGYRSQVHFREIHTRRSSAGLLSPEELQLYKFHCGQCSFSFRRMESLQQHTLWHLMQSVTRCRLCSASVSSLERMRRHVETAHGDLSPDEVKSQMGAIEENARLLFSSPAYEQFTSRMLLVNGAEKAPKNGVFSGDNEDEDEEMTSSDFLNGLKENIRNEEDMDESDGMPVSYKEKQFLEDYMNSHSMAEEHYRDNSRKFKCHRCRVAFTNPRYLYAHNKTAQHRLGDRMAVDPMENSRPYRCDVCNESFTQKSLLLAHNNSVSHLHKLKQHTQLNGELLPPFSLAASTSSGSLSAGTPGSHSAPPPLSSSPKVNATPSSSQPGANGNFEPENGAWEREGKYRPYKCNVCKVGYSNAPSLDIHMRSVAHKAKASKMAELAHSAQMDMSSSQVEHADAKAMGKQQAQLIADMIHQQATAQAASNTAASLYNMPGMSNMNTMAQLSLLQGLLPGSHLLPQSAQNALAAMSSAQLETFEALRNMAANQVAKDTRDGPKTKADGGSQPNEGKPDPTKDKLNMKINAKPDLTEKIINMVIKQDGKIEPASEVKSKALTLDDKQNKFLPGFGMDMKGAKKEEELPPNFPHAPVLARPRGFMGRFKPQLHRSLLENFGFECVMHFNEEHSTRIGEQRDDTGEENSPENEKDEKDEEEQDKIKEEAEEKTEEDEVIKETKEVEESEKKEEETKETEEEKRDDNKENIDLPELNKVKCLLCNKDFSNVWVLKNHEEEIHNNFVSPEIIEDFGKKFKEEWEKNLPKPPECEAPATPTQPLSNPPTPTPEKPPATEMPPPPPPPSQPQNMMNFDMSQLLPLMGMNLLPMHLPMNLVGLGLQNSLMPSLMMPPSMDLPQGFLPQMPPPPPHLVDGNSGPVSSQQHLQAAAAAAAAQQANQKRVRTRISDDQLKVLRQYFDINNSPSEEQINKMSEQTGLPQKVIKHWFRNTLFKERQRNKDSPYNFNNPPSTSIDLDEYDRTGKIPEVKIEPEEEEESAAPAPSAAPQADKENPVVKEENTNNSEKDIDQDSDCLENPPLKIDLAPKPEPTEEAKKEHDSHSNTSSPSNTSSIPSTPTASAPATPTPMITSNTMTPNPLTFSLDAYAANMARLEAATFQSMGKRANRTRFTDFQIKTLQEYFERNAYPKDDELEHLSKMLGLSARVIVVWFQNARQKARKIYENQPANEVAKDPAAPFQRTPGLNYQCKKCNSVFQRYYELIKHQKNSCLGESNNNKPIPSMADDDSSNISYNSNEDSNFSERNIPSSATPGRERELLPRALAVETTSISTTMAKLGPASASHTTSSPSTSSSSSSNPTFKCDKCTLTFPRFDMWQDHQKAHNVAPAMFTPFSSSSAFGMLQTLAHQEDSKAVLAMSAVSTPSSMHPTVVTTPIPAAHQPPSMTSLPTSVMSTSPSPATTKRKTDSEDESGEQPRDKRLRTTILPEQLDYLYQQYQVSQHLVIFQ